MADDGYRRLTEQLKRNGRAVNHERVQHLMRLMNIQSKNKRTTEGRHGFPRYPNLDLDMEIVRPDQVWACDITYIHLHRDFVYLAVIMDIFTRGVRGRHLGRSLDHSLTLMALQRAVAMYPAPVIHHSDRAPVSPFVFSGGEPPFPAEGGTAQRLTHRSKDQWGQSVTWRKREARVPSNRRAPSEQARQGES